MVGGRLPRACTTNNGNTWLYRDSAHLSVEGAITLTDRFNELIRVHAE